MTAPATTPVLGHDAYWSEDVFAAEATRVFARSWLFAGLVTDFPPGDHDLVLGGLAITVTAGETGLATRHGEGDAEIARCGRLVFVRRLAGGPGLDEYLAPYGDVLARISRDLTRVDHHARVEAPVNWKVLVENTLDDCHSATVHTASLQPAMDPDWLARYRPDRQGDHSVMGNDLGTADAAFWTRLAGRLPLARHHDEAVYRHLFIFPNLYVATFFGAMVILHRVEPIAPEAAVLKMTTCLPVTRDLTRSERALHGAVLRDLTAKAAIVVAEDLAVCRLAQRGHRFAPHPGLLGTRERRIADFQQALWRRMG